MIEGYKQTKVFEFIGILLFSENLTFTAYKRQKSQFQNVHAATHRFVIPIIRQSRKKRKISNF